MTFPRLLLRNLLYHWRANLALLAGVAVGCAVLTGALVVGDSLRGSLQARALAQLGWVDQALVANRFFREELAAKLPARKVSPAILVQGSVASHVAGSSYANNVTVLAVDDRFWPDDQMPVDKSFWKSNDAGVVLNPLLAGRLNVKTGDKIVLLLQSADNVPRETLVGRRKPEDVLSRLDVTVQAVLPDQGLAHFTLRPGPAPPANAFVPLRLMQERKDNGGKTPLTARINAILVAGAEVSLSDALRRSLTLDDWGLELRTPEDRAHEQFKLLSGGDADRPDWGGELLRQYRWKGRVPEALAKKAQPAKNDEPVKKDEPAKKDDKERYLTIDAFVDFYNMHHGYLGLSSPRIFLEAPAASAAQQAAAHLGWQAAPTLTYMVDSIGDGKAEMAYAIVAGLDPTLKPPLGPFLPANTATLADNEIVLAEWPGNPIATPAGQVVTLLYDIPDATGTLLKKRAQLTSAGSIPMTGAADDPDLTPRFPGITDKLTIRDWADDLPFTVDRKRLKKADNAYWDRYRATPKAYVTLKTAQDLWGGRYGNLTSIRLAPGKSATTAEFEQAARDYRQELLKTLQPETGGFVFQDMRATALAAGQGSGDFGLYFLSFSCFLIVAALLLVGLMVRLSLDQRAGEMGLLLAVGWRRGSVRRLVLSEGLVLAAVGAAFGIGGALLYAQLLLDYLSVLWPGGLETTLLHLYVNPWSCVIGYVASLAIALFTIFLSTRTLKRAPPWLLLSGQTILPETVVRKKRKGFWAWWRRHSRPMPPLGIPPARTSLWVTIALVMAMAVCLGAGAVATDHEARAGSFVCGGMLALGALLAALWWWMRRSRHRDEKPLSRLAPLAVRNATRHPVRSVLTVGLLAGASFMIVAVQAFHRDPGRDFLEKTGGSGGFAWVGESTVPIFQDLNTPAGREAVGLHLRDYDVTFMPFRLRPGDDASCLNLYQPLQPRILGVPDALIERGGFRFASHEGNAANPWQLLRQKRDDGAIPAIGEATTVEYILKSGLGKEITIRDGQGAPVRLHFVALLQDSVFQSEVLIADAAFVKLFPTQEGFQFFLIDGPPPSTAEDQSWAAKRPGIRGPLRIVSLDQKLTADLADYGFSMTPSAERLQSYLDVENTYLATFQSLGALGLLLGTLGLAVVLVRSVWERRGELALLRALGFRRSALGWLVLVENAWLLALGLIFGGVAAAVAVAPFAVAQGGTILQLQFLLLLLATAIVGLACGAIAMWTTLRVPLLPALRRE
jgi:ABC-type lipoprotein release transport system permease subunit